MMYEVNCDSIKTTIQADGLREAEYKAYQQFGLDAIGVSINSLEDDSFSFTVCKESWKYVLKEYFPSFSMNDVLNHLMVVCYAWLNFESETYEDYDGKTISLCQDGLEYISKNDKLSVEMDRINFRW